MDITIKASGTIVANGRKTLGDQFSPNNRFPIISSTGIEGEGCQVLEPEDTGENGSMDNGGSTNTSNDVSPNTTSDQLLPNTGGVPVYAVVVSSVALAGASVLLRTTIRRNT